MEEQRRDLSALVRAARTRVTRTRTETPETPAPPTEPRPVEVDDDEPIGSILVRADQATWVRPADGPARRTHLPPRSVRARTGR